MMRAMSDFRGATMTIGTTVVISITEITITITVPAGPGGRD